MTFEELEKLLEEQYPIFRRSDNDIYRLRGIECGIGWVNLLVDFAEKLKELQIEDHQIEIIQIKEKFFGLRIYYRISGVDEETCKKVSDYVFHLEEQSWRVCIRCAESIVHRDIDHPCDHEKTTIEYHYQQLLKRLGGRPLIP